MDSIVNIGETETGVLQTIARENDTTLSTVSQLAVGIMLQKQCGTADILVGNVVSGRNVPLKGIETAVGMLINTIPLRIRRENDNVTVREMLVKLNELNNACNEYDHASLTDMKVGSRTVSDYIKILYVFENYPETDDSEMNDMENQLRLEGLNMREQTNYDLTISAFINEEKLSFKFAYNPKKYSDKEIHILENHLVAVLEQIIKDPSAKVSSIEMLTEEERKQIQEEFNDTDETYARDRTMVDLFEEQVQRYSDNTALVYNGTELTYSEVNAMANSLAMKLRELGVKPDDLVAIVAERSPEMVCAILGVLKSGGAYVPMDPSYPEERIRFMLEDCAPKAVLVYQAKIDTELPVLDLADDSVWEGVHENP